MHRVRVARSLPRLARDHPQDQLLEVGGDACDALARLHRRSLERHGEHLHGHLRVEGQLAGDHLVGHDAQRIDVAERGRVLSVDVLGRDVPRRPEALRRERERRRVDDLRDAEVGQLGEVRALARDEQHVLGLEVAVNDAELVRAPEGGRDLQGDADRPDHVEAALGERGLEGVALHVLHHEIDQPAVLAEVRDLDDVRMVDPVDRAGLAQEALAVRHVHPEVLAQDLDRAEPLDHHVPREIHDGHPSAAEATDEPIPRGERAADEGVRVARERRAVERAEPRVVGVGLGAPRAHLHRSTKSTSDLRPSTRRYAVRTSLVTAT